MWTRLIAVIVSLGMVIAVAGCNGAKQGPEDPKHRLNEYISKSFGVKGVEDRNALASFLTGQAKIRLYAWSDDQFRQAFVDSKRQFIKLAFTEIKPISADEVSITYELSYIDQGRGHDAKVTNRKLAQMVRENGKWMIRDVSNIKEMVEYRNEMSL